MTPRLLVFTLLAASAAFGQNITATVTGKVSDQNGGAIPDAAVALANLATNLTLSALSNETGQFVFPLVRPGRYRLTVSKPGFQKYATEAFDLNVDQTQRVDVTLRVGEISEAVTVFDKPALVESECEEQEQCNESTSVVNDSLDIGSPLSTRRTIGGSGIFAQHQCKNGNRHAGGGTHSFDCPDEQDSTADFFSDGQVSPRSQLHNTCDGSIR